MKVIKQSNKLALQELAIQFKEVREALQLSAQSEHIQIGKVKS